MIYVYYFIVRIEKKLVLFYWLWLLLHLSVDCGVSGLMTHTSLRWIAHVAVEFIFCSWGRGRVAFNTFFSLVGSQGSPTPLNTSRPHLIYSFLLQFHQPPTTLTICPAVSPSVRFPDRLIVGSIYVVLSLVIRREGQCSNDWHPQMVSTTLQILILLNWCYPPPHFRIIRASPSGCICGINCCVFLGPCPLLN